MKGKRGEEGLLVHDVAGPAHCVACRALRVLRCVSCVVSTHNHALRTLRVLRKPLLMRRFIPLPLLSHLSLLSPPIFLHLHTTPLALPSFLFIISIIDINANMKTGYILYLCSTSLPYICGGWLLLSRSVHSSFMLFSSLLKLNE